MRREIPNRMFFILFVLFILYHIYHSFLSVDTNSRPSRMLNITEFEAAINRSDATEKKLPGAVIIGVKKCGTGALIEMLKMHPQVAVPNYFRTEIRFWGFDDLYGLGLGYYKVSK